MNSWHIVSEHQCNICDKYLCNAWTLKQHNSAIHHGVKPFQCPTCDKRFNRKHHLNAHIENIHEGRKFVCGKCDKICNSIDNLKTDALIQVEKLYICEFCGQGYAQSTRLTDHHRHHLNIKLHQCPVCDRRFVTNYEVKSHARIHCAQKPHV